MLTVFLVDDHEVVRRGVGDLLDEEEDLSVVGQAGSVAEALARIPALRPDVAVLDVRLPDGNGVELCRELRSRMPQLNCLILTSYTDEHAMMDAILAGAGGYVMKDIKGMELVSAVRAVGSGRSLLDTRAAAALMARLRSDAQGPIMAVITAANGISAAARLRTEEVLDTPRSCRAPSYCVSWLADLTVAVLGIALLGVLAGFTAGTSQRPAASPSHRT